MDSFHNATCTQLARFISEIFGMYGIVGMDELKTTPLLYRCYSIEPRLVIQDEDFKLKTTQ